jgi:hypothetical protein
MTLVIEVSDLSNFCELCTTFYVNSAIWTGQAMEREITAVPLELKWLQVLHAMPNIFVSFIFDLNKSICLMMERK